MYAVFSCAAPNFHIALSRIPGRTEIKSKDRRQCFLQNITIEPQTPVIYLFFKRRCKANQYHSPQTVTSTQENSQKQNNTKTQTNEKEHTQTIR